jgi:hypothetical protein
LVIRAWQFVVIFFLPEQLSVLIVGSPAGYELRIADHRLRMPLAAETFCSFRRFDG